MRTLIIGLSVVFFAAAVIVTAMALSVPSSKSARLAFPVGTAAAPSSPALEESLDRLLEEQTSNQALVEGLRQTMTSLQEELASGREAGSFDRIVQEQVDNRVQVNQLQETITALQEELAASRHNDSLDRIAHEQAANSAQVNRLQETITALQEELATSRHNETPDRIAHEQAADSAQANQPRETIAALQEEPAANRQERTEGDGDAPAPSGAAAPVPRQPTPPPPGGETPAGGRTIAILGGGLFNSGQFELTPELETAVQRVLPDIVSHPRHKVLVEGHSDSRPVGTRLNEKLGDNTVLSRQRAEAVAGLLVTIGVEESRIESAGRGDTRPLAPNNIPGGRAENRRVEIWLIPAPLPAGED